MPINFVSSFLRLALTQSKADFLAKQYKISPEDVEKIAAYDPTSNNAYTAWLCKVFNSHGIDYLERLVEPIKKFEKLKNSPDFPKDKKDIGKYTPEDLLKLVGTERSYRRNLSQKEIEKTIMTKGLPGAELVWNSDGFKMWHVTNPKYARFLSSNTSWCTAQPNYSVHYCGRGGLYPVYFHDKPIAQGHIEFNGGITFLNKEDSSISLSDPLMLEMLLRVKHPAMQSFKKKALNKDALMSALRSTEDKDEIEALKQLAMETDAKVVSNLIIALSDEVSVLWAEGIEALLDHPAVLYDTIIRVDIETVTKIAKTSPELADEVFYELSSNGLLEGKDGNRIAIQLLQNPTKEQLQEFTQSLLANPTNVGKDWPELFELVKEDIESDSEIAPEGHTKRYVEFLEANREYPSLKGAVKAYWKKYVNDKWPVFESELKDDPDYEARLKQIANVARRIAKGEIVTPGPDYTGSKGPEVKGEIMQSTRQGETKTVVVKWSDGDEETISFTKGQFPLDSASEEEVIVEPLDPFTIKVGDLVTPNEKIKRSIDLPKGTIGRVTEVIRDNPDDPQPLIIALWENGFEQSGGYFAYRFDKVTIKKKERKPKTDSRFGDLLELPETLSNGDRVKRGPSWHWHNQDGGAGNLGTVTQANSEDDGEWTVVQWDEGGSNSYRYGDVRENLPFSLDIVPEDCEYPEDMTSKEIEEVSEKLAEIFGIM